MAKSVLIRNLRAGDDLEIFLVSAVSSLLGVRLYLHLSGYPQVGGDTLHVAHMLYGGLLMMAAIVIALAFLGNRVHRITAVVGGLGFGIFIDELGKFITRDNNYFYQPTIALIYAVFASLFLLFRFLTASRVLTDKEYLINALNQLEEMVRDNMDPLEKREVLDLLAKAGSSEPLALSIARVVQHTEPHVAVRPRLAVRIGRQALRHYEVLSQRAVTRRLIQVFFSLEAVLLSLGIGSVIVTTAVHLFIDTPANTSRLAPAEISQLVSSSLAAVFLALGTLKIASSRLQAYQLFQRATLIQIFLTSFFQFYLQEFAALTEFALNVGLFLILRLAITAERQTRSGATGVASVQPATQDVASLDKSQSR